MTKWTCLLLGLIISSLHSLETWYFFSKLDRFFWVLFPPFCLITRVAKNWTLRCWVYSVYYACVVQKGVTRVHTVLHLLVKLSILLPKRCLVRHPLTGDYHPLHGNSAYGMQIIRTSLEKLEIFGRTADIIHSAWQTGMQKAYQTYIKQWTVFCVCAEQDRDPFQSKM